MPTASVLVAGLGPLGAAVVDRLQGAGLTVTVLATPAEAAAWELEAARREVRLLTGPASAPAVLAAAGIAGLGALVLTASDDAENVDAALCARRLRADLPVVVRIFDDHLAQYLRETLEGVTVLSMSAIAAPVFAEAALAAIAASAPSHAAGRARRRRRRGPGAMDRIVGGIAVAAALLIGAGTAYFAHALELGWLDALYFVWTTVFTVGYGDITPRHASALAKLSAMTLMLGGAALVAVLYALLAGWVVERRLAVLRGHVAVRGGGHLIVAGAGRVGVRVAERLRERGHRTVVVERDPECVHIERLRARGCQVIVADASETETLDLAGVDRAAALVALTDSDAANLRIALAGRARQPGLPVVARLTSPDLSAHVSERSDAVALSSVALASEAFARAAIAATCPPAAEAAGGGRM